MESTREEEHSRRKIIQVPKQDDEIIFQVDFKLERFSQVYQRINSLFEGNYLKFILQFKDCKDINIKEIYVLMRKYQFFFSSFKLNSSIVFNFNSSGDCYLDQLSTFYNINNANKFIFNLSLLPKFKKNEINFTIPDDLLEMEITLNAKINLVQECYLCEFINSQVEISNLRNVLNLRTFNILSQLLSQVLDSFLANYSDNLIQGVNKYLVYLENYFPEIFQKAFENFKIQKGVWTQEEQNLLEAALLKFKDEPNSKEKFKKISQFIQTKSLKEVVQRYKNLATLTSNNPQSQDAQEPEPNKKNPAITVENPPITPEEKAKEKLVITPVEDTNDIVDEIMNQFDQLYSNVTFESIKPEDPPTEEATIEEYYDEEEEEEDDDDEKITAQAEINKEELLNTEVVDRLQESKLFKITEEHLNIIRNVLKFGSKSKVNLNALQMRNVALAEICEINLFLKCDQCKKVGFESKYQKLNKKANIFYLGSTCPKCGNEIYSIFKSELLHPENLTNAGIVFAIGAIVIDFLPSTFLINCLNCPDVYKKVKLRNGGLSSREAKCSSCNGDITFYIYSSHIAMCGKIDYSFLDGFEINNFTKFNMTIEDDSTDSYVKKYDKIIQVGNPLPDKGTCKHYRLSFRWFRFSCCNKVFPCDLCHDDISTHEAEYAKQILCGHCAFEQSSENKICCKCGKGLAKESFGGFWEGGKGCRDKALMSNKDSHKYKSSEAKTISRKKKEQILMNK